MCGRGEWKEAVPRPSPPYPSPVEGGGEQKAAAAPVVLGNPVDPETPEISAVPRPSPPDPSPVEGRGEQKATAALEVPENPVDPEISKSYGRGCLLKWLMFWLFCEIRKS